MTEYSAKAVEEKLAADRARLAQIVRTETTRFVAIAKPTMVRRPRVMVQVGPKQFRIRLPAPQHDERPLQQEPVLWQAIFTAFYGRPPKGGDDPAWEDLFDRKIYRAMSYLPDSTFGCAEEK